MVVLMCLYTEMAFYVSLLQTISVLCYLTLPPILLMLYYPIYMQVL